MKEFTGNIIEYLVSAFGSQGRGIGIRRILLGTGFWVLGAIMVLGQIATISLSVNPVCQGSNIDVTFTSTGTYNSTNIFTAQLSDASGNFTSPTPIGTYPGSSIGTFVINSVIPLSITGSTGYLIRVISSDPADELDPGIPVIIAVFPTTADAGPDQTGAATCGLTSVTLAANTPVVGTGLWTIVSGTEEQSLHQQARLQLLQEPPVQHMFYDGQYLMHHVLLQMMM